MGDARAGMAYDHGLAERVRDAFVTGAPTEKRMFGGIAWMERGNLVVGVLDDGLIARLGPGADDAVSQGAAPFAPTGRPMKGWAVLPPELLADDDQLREWVARARAFAHTLPEK